MLLDLGVEAARGQHVDSRITVIVTVTVTMAVSAMTQRTGNHGGEQRQKHDGGEAHDEQGCDEEEKVYGVEDDKCGEWSVRVGVEQWRMRSKQLRRMQVSAST